MSSEKISCILSACLLLIVIPAYIDVWREKEWYKKQFNSHPRKPYRLIPRVSWQQKFVNTILLRKKQAA